MEIYAKIWEVMPEKRLESIKAKPASPGDQFVISPAEKERMNRRLVRVENGNKFGHKATLFNKISQQRFELLASFQQQVLAIFTSSGYDLDQTRQAVEKMSAPKEWKEKALEVLDNIESGRKYFTYQDNINNYIEIVKRQQNIPDLRVVASDTWPVDITKFGILPLAANRLEAEAVLNKLTLISGMQKFYRYSIVINQDSPQFNVNRAIKHEMEHWFQLIFQSGTETEINNNPKNHNNFESENLKVSNIIARELGAYLKSHFDTKNNNFGNWYEEFFTVKFKLTRISGGFSFGSYFNEVLELFPQFVPVLEDHFLTCLKLYKSEIQSKLENGQNLENIIIWLRSNRLKIEKSEVKNTQIDKDEG